MDASNLPTDSLYKMLTIGGLVLVIGGIAIGWKAIDESQASSIALADSEGVFANAQTPLQLQFKSIWNAFRKIEKEMKMTISGVNMQAAKEFKGGQPTDFPALADTLKIEEGYGIEWGVSPEPVVKRMASLEEWLSVVSRMRRHKDSVDDFLTAPNLKVIGDELKKRGIESSDGIQAQVDELERKALALAAPQEGFDRATLRHNLARSRQRLLVGVALVLFVVGVSVFARASKNWYEQVQRYQDAKLKYEAREYSVGGEISMWHEARSIGISMAIALLLVGLSMLLGV